MTFMINQALYGKKHHRIKEFLLQIKPFYCIIALTGSIILAFGLYNIHSISEVTEGGVLGLTLLLDYWFDISPSVSGFVLNVVCYVIGWKLLGKKFIFYSIISTSGFSLSYALFESYPPVYPEIANMPLVATVVGALFVGVSAGMCVRVGGAPSGDDALAMSLAKALKVNIEYVYFLSDVIVLIMSLSYIPIEKMVYSLLTVILSGQIIGVVVKIKFRKKPDKSMT